MKNKKGDVFWTMVYKNSTQKELDWHNLEKTGMFFNFFNF